MDEPRLGRANDSSGYLARAGSGPLTSDPRFVRRLGRQIQKRRQCRVGGRRVSCLLLRDIENGGMGVVIGRWDRGERAVRRSEINADAVADHRAYCIRTLNSNFHLSPVGGCTKKISRLPSSLTRLSIRTGISSPAE